MKISFNTMSLSRFFLLLSIIFIPINFDYFSFRLSDFTLLLSLTVFAFNVKFSKYYIYLLIYLLLSPLVSFFIHAFNNLYLILFIEKFIFIYKYILIVSVIFLYKFHLENSLKFEYKLILTLYSVFIFLSSWVFIYQYLVLNGYIIGVLRPSFPFSRDYWYSDAHLYSSLLAMFLLSYIFYIGRYLNHNILVFVFTCFFTFLALVFTGSRGGLLIFSLFFLIFLMIKFIFSKKTNLFFITILILIFILPLFFQFFTLQFDFDAGINSLLERAFNFNFSDDASSNARIDNLRVALNDFSSGYYVLGIGPLSSSLKWYDGIFSIIISHYGLVGYFLLISFVLYVLVKFYFKSGYFVFTFLLIFVSYFIMNAITEYVLVFRNMLPSIGLIMIFYVNAIKYDCLDRSND